MKTVLVPVETHALVRSVLTTALLLGRSLGSYIEGFALGPDIPDVYAIDVPVAVPPILDEAARREMAAGARQLFESFMQEHRVPERFGEPNGLSFGWQGGTLQGDSYVGDYGRAFDIIVVGRPSSRSDGPRLATLE